MCDCCEEFSHRKFAISGGGGDDDDDGGGGYPSKKCSFYDGSNSSATVSNFHACRISMPIFYVVAAALYDRFVDRFVGIFVLVAACRRVWGGIAEGGSRTRVTFRPRPLRSFCSS